MARFFCIALVTVCLASCTFADNEEEKYSNKYDHLDVDSVLLNNRLRTQYYQCFMDSGPCATPDAIFFKALFPEAMVTKCRKCTERQKIALEKIATWYTDNEPDNWEALIRKAVDDFTKKGDRKRAGKTV